MLRNVIFNTTIVLLVHTWCFCSATITVGRCPLDKYMETTRRCTSQFIQEFQTNPASCSSAYNLMIECIKDIVRVCLRGYVSDSEIETHLQKAVTNLKAKEYYCNSGSFQPPMLSDFEKKNLPCFKEFFIEAPKCTMILREKLKTNPADPTLCREFLLAKNCMKGYLEDYCVLDNRIKAITAHAFDQYNPFCNVTFVPPPNGFVAPPPQPMDGNAWMINPGLDSRKEEENEGRQLTLTEDQPGRCSFLAQLNRTRACTTLFVRSYQSNPMGNCSKMFTKMLDCVKCVIRSCLEDYFAGAEMDFHLKETINRTKTKDFYCQGMIEVPVFNSEDGYPACDQEYARQADGCLRDLGQTFRQNISSSKMCSDFTQAKLCLRQVIGDHCRLDDSGLSQTLEYTYIVDDYNPFCTGNRDMRNGTDDISLTSVHSEPFDPCLKASFGVSSNYESGTDRNKLNTIVVFGVLLLRMFTLIAEN